ncbi:uncharacterized protein LOC119077608 isoform X2 [Bradysia coprophila]|uniref:uncharacterized protein LOC119077608 isoform X2 n=1 Tax=Bradysia coprophila TaxID=38358 RepID=UPI00187DD630|nr:uncharacterized protein LOC119077608 isoform X2 [Bradysia coprophila]
MASDLNQVKVGQQVVLTIGDNGRLEGDYFGRVCVINKEKTRIHLKDIEYGPAQQKLSGTKLFFLPEILAVKIISDVEDDDSGNERTEATSEDRIKFELNVRQKEKIQSLIRNRCMIETVGDEYDKALEDISHYYFVGLTAQVGDGESGYVICSTPHKIYGFNITTIGGINGKFKEWFESDTYTKVVRSANTLEENLFYCHEINVRGVFDTNAVHRMLESRVELPLELVEEMDCSNGCRVDTLIERTSILLKLHDFLTEHLLTNAYQLFQLNMDYFRSMASIDLQLYYRRGKSIVNGQHAGNVQLNDHKLLHEEPILFKIPLDCGF